METKDIIFILIYVFTFTLYFYCLFYILYDCLKGMVEDVRDRKEILMIEEEVKRLKEIKKLKETKK